MILAAQDVSSGGTPFEADFETVDQLREDAVSVANPKVAVLEANVDSSDADVPVTPRIELCGHDLDTEVDEEYGI